MVQELLRQVRIVDPLSQVDRVADVLIEAGKIVEIASPGAIQSKAAAERDCTGLVLAPGLVDLYSHADEPGFETRETLASLTAAAIAGGFTRLTLLPDTPLPLDHTDGLARLHAQISSDLPLHVQAWGAITQKLEGQQLVEFGDMIQAGVVGFSDGRPVQNSMLLRRLCEYLGAASIPIALWPCDPALAGNGVIRPGLEALQLGLTESPTMAETAVLAALLEMVAELKTPIHLMRVSTARSVALIQRAKERNLPITASTTWMHLLGNSESLRTYDVNWRLDPPVGNVQDQAALIRGLESGVIDAIAMDHHAYTYEEKTVAFSATPPGAIGLELALPLLWQTFVATRRWSPLTLWQTLSTSPCHCLGQSPPTLQPGQSAEMILFDPQQAWTANAQTLHSLSCNTPWYGHTLTGRVLKTWHPRTQSDPLECL
ncbi:dihydroorotase [Acaryochloris sp. IP29b_bin.148]|uniref:dihydroorotase n=1 Tax=Acaryochloris sp. IP29b_bin.148 TaxID=2969218 RepID=UPI00262D3405|nr:dihydroorotase [Acaryochloris sp. IP29b_bin.148]